MNEELKKYVMSKIYYLIGAWIWILGMNAILMLAALDCGYNNFSTFISLITPFLITIYGLLWWIGVNAEFNKIKKLQVMDDTGVSLSVRDWKGKENDKISKN